MERPSCPYCGSSSVKKQGASYKCNDCQARFSPPESSGTGLGALIFVIGAAIVGIGTALIALSKRFGVRNVLIGVAVVLALIFGGIFIANSLAASSTHDRLAKSADVYSTADRSKGKYPHITLAFQEDGSVNCFLEYKSDSGNDDETFSFSSFDVKPHIFSKPEIVLDDGTHSYALVIDSESYGKPSLLHMVNEGIYLSRLSGAQVSDYQDATDVSPSLAEENDEIGEQVVAEVTENSYKYLGRSENSSKERYVLKFTPSGSAELCSYENEADALAETSSFYDRYFTTVTARTYNSGVIAFALYEDGRTVPSMRIRLSEGTNTDALYYTDDDGKIYFDRIA